MSEQLTMDAPAHRTAGTVSPLKMTARNVNVFYGDKQAIKDVSIDVDQDHVTAFIGPSGCGKSTFLRTLNRMNDTVESARVEGTITLDGEDIYGSGMDVVQLRARVGMVFQKPNPFPKSIYENVAYGPRIHGLTSGKAELDRIVEKSLRRAGLWEEVKDRLLDSGTALSGGQQQRLCIARAIAVDPEVILMDEPCSALDPIATAKIEELIHELRGRYAIVIVTHNMQQAARVSDKAGAEGAKAVVISAAIEAEIVQMDAADRPEFLAELGLSETGLARIIRAGYELLDLITFFTVGPKEARAWTVEKGARAPQAAGAIHTDFERGFIRAETMSYQDYVTLGGEAAARDAGRLRSEGKDYVVHDGDIMLFRFNV